MMKSALIVIDVQQALATGEYEAVDAHAVIARINALSAHARRAGMPVVFIQHESSGPLLAHGSPGWQFAQGLNVQAGDVRIEKRASDSFHNTPLHDVLQELKVERLVICGFQSEFCVDTTTRRALALGYAVALVADGHSTMNSVLLSATQIVAHHNLTLSNITSFATRATPAVAADIVF